MEIEKDGIDANKEYTEEFNKLAEGGEPTKAEKPAPAPKPEEEEIDPPAPESEKEPPSEGEPKTEESEQEAAEPKGDVGLTKALKDTKAWATKLAMEKATLEKEVAALKAGNATPSKVEEAKAAAGETRKVLDEKIKKVSEDYPELKDVLDLLAKTSDEALSKAQNFDNLTAKQAEQLEARTKFETDVEPEIVKVHPDFRKVAFSKEYMAWVEKQSPATQYAAMNSLDPEDINGTITKYKKSLASGDAEKAKADEIARQKGIRENLSGMRGGGSVSKNGGQITKLEDIDPNDREAAFAFLAAQDEKKKR